MNSHIAEIVRRHCRPLTPLPTGVAARLDLLPGIRAVLFDIYGTLLVSGAGDISLQTGTSNDDAFRAVLTENGMPQDAVSELSSELLQQTIFEHQSRDTRRGVEFPEVDIVEVWRDTLTKIGDLIAGSEEILPALDPGLLAVQYECRINPVWPMPGITECLQEIRKRKLLLGIVSNAQAMTPQLFPALLGQTFDNLGFASDLRFLSYLYGESKPGLKMFNAAAAALDQVGVTPKETIYVGNDMLNDVWAASQVGFRTVLFAGDDRSLRLRAENERVRGCVPDAVVADLASIGACLDCVN